MRNRPARGATKNAASNRFALPIRDADGDWLDWRETVDGTEPVLRTTVTIEQPRTIIARKTSPDMPFDRSINPYLGREQSHTVARSGQREVDADMWQPLGLDLVFKAKSLQLPFRFINVTIAANDRWKVMRFCGYATAPISGSRNRTFEVVSPSVIDEPQFPSEHGYTIPTTGIYECVDVIGPHPQFPIGRQKSSGFSERVKGRRVHHGRILSCDCSTKQRPILSLWNDGL